MKKSLIILLLYTLTHNLNGQSIHYSQYNEFSSMLNPASTGLTPDHDFLVGLIYRNQWKTLPSPYSTFALNTDFSVYLGENYPNGWLGIGVAMLNDVAGDADQKNNRFQSSIAYHQRLNENNILSIGFTGGYNNMSLEFDKLTYAEQWDGLEYNPILPNGEPLDLRSLNYLYINSGVNYYYLKESFSLRVGYSIHNLNKPTPSYLSTFSPLAFRHLITTEATIQAGDQMMVKPIFNYSTQANAREILIGAGLYYNMGVSGKTYNVVFSGVNMRLGDAVTPYIGYEEDRWKFIMSYDATISDLATHNSSKGAFELGLIIHSSYPHGNSMKEKLVCPRF